MGTAGPLVPDASLWERVLRGPTTARALLVAALALALALPARGQGALGPALDAAGVGEAGAFYADRAWRPLWTTADGLSDPGRALVAALGRVDEDGLSPDAYTVALGSGPAEDEAALTAAFLRLGRHLTRGRVDPREAHRDWRAKRRPFDTADMLRLAAERGPAAAVQAARPPHNEYAGLRRVLAALRAQAGRPWPPLPDGPVLREGDAGPAVAALRQRLVALGDLPPAEGVGDRFDAALAAAVRRAQDRHGVAVDGVVGPETRAALDATPAERAAQVALNMERWRWLPDDLGGRHLLVDVAGMTAALVDGGRAVWSARAIVGTPRTPTPGLSSEVTHVVLSPFWNVPASIAQNEILPRLARDPSYLARHDMERLPGGSLRQRPGPTNPLGPAKLIFDNPFGVRVHGTSAPGLFERRARALSHGCVRVERPLDLADRLLPDWDADRIAEAVARGREEWVALDAPVPVHITYWTARVDADGAVRYRPDVYGRDRALARALGP